MTAYIIFNPDQPRCYSSIPGSEHSYTSKLENAEVFLSERAARANCCGNEIAMPLPDIMKGWPS